MTTWMDDAACATAPPDLFFPPEGREGQAVAARALALCRQCPVRAACFEAAVSQQLHDGIWGGTTPAQRSGRRATASVGWS